MYSIETELSIFFYACFSGGSVAAAYRILVCIRQILPHSSLAAGIEDLFFMTAAGTYLFSQMYSVTFGQIRWYFVLGALFGILLEEMLVRFLLRVFR